MSDALFNSITTTLPLEEFLLFIAELCDPDRELRPTEGDIDELHYHALEHLHALEECRAILALKKQA
jgi:hypothetical protein